MKNLFVCNLSFSTSEQDLESLFEKFGAVRSANLVTDKDTGHSRGFAFIKYQ